MFFCMLGVLTLQAQKTVSGTITGGDGIPLIGVNVLEAADRQGLSSDYPSHFMVPVWWDK